VNRPVAIVTGAGIGIGAAIAVRLARTYDLIITHLQLDPDVHSVVTQAARSGASARVITGDLARPMTIDALAVAMDEVADRLDVLVCNAGAYPRSPRTELNLDQFRHHNDINLIAHATCAKLVTPTLTARGHGRIVTVSSVLNQLGHVDLAGHIAAKSGLEGLVRTLARELGPHDITVNCVRAGSIEVPAEHAVVADHAAAVTRQLDRQCIKRRGQPTDIAAVVEFFCSPAADFVTGQCLTVDGGWCLG
jgi:NAD(P)-dependent dehydrogenase (short-subunit alcohol dehydrogenase family)